MPRTVLPQPQPQFKDDPQWNNPSHLRGCAEGAHYEREQSVFFVPLSIRPATSTEGSRLLVFRNYRRKQCDTMLETLTPEDCRLFCWKDCAIYANTAADLRDHTSLFDVIYRDWFPHRAEDKDVSDNSFFAKYMCFHPPVAKVDEVIRFHDALWEKLCALEPEIPDRLPLGSGPALLLHNFDRPIVDHRLRNTFGTVFIILVDGWQEDGVLLVFKNASEAARHHCVNDANVSRYDGRGCGDLKEACVFRCSLKRAMELVVSIDPVRATHRSEYNEHLAETLGDSNE